MTPLVSGRHIRTLSVHVSCPIAGVLAMPERDDVPSIPSFARVRLHISTICECIFYLISLCTLHSKGDCGFLGHNWTAVESSDNWTKETKSMNRRWSTENLLNIWTLDNP